jgi:hypothetical protein
MAVAAAAAILTPKESRAEDRRFTSPPIDTARNDHIVYAPVVLKPFGARPGNTIAGPAARWTDIDLFGHEFADTGGRYRVLDVAVVCDPNWPEARPQIEVTIGAEGPLPEGPPPTIALLDLTTGLQTQAAAEVATDCDRTVYRAVLAVPKAALVPPGYRVYLNPRDRYELQLIAGVHELVAGSRQTLPTFGGTDRREWPTKPRRPGPNGRRRRDACDY